MSLFIALYLTLSLSPSLSPAKKETSASKLKRDITEGNLKRETGPLPKWEPHKKPAPPASSDRGVGEEGELKDVFARLQKRSEEQEAKLALEALDEEIAAVSSELSSSLKCNGRQK